MLVACKKWKWVGTLNILLANIRDNRRTHEAMGNKKTRWYKTLVSKNTTDFFLRLVVSIISLNRQLMRPLREVSAIEKFKAMLIASSTGSDVNELAIYQI